MIQPPGAVVLDLSVPEPRFPETPWTIGRYDEPRPALYQQALFGGDRMLHVGMDFGGPVGVAVHAFLDGEVVHSGYNAAAGDYGYVLVTGHEHGGRPLYALWGHLSAASIVRSPAGGRFVAGAVLGWLGDEHENGGWPPHLHLQLSWDRPETHDLPGVVSAAEREAALGRYPDPRMVLGPLY
jgi:murein DD-endopeptidase MepM/ murein hydrolase activator NlpD